MDGVAVGTGDVVSFVNPEIEGCDLSGVLVATKTNLCLLLSLFLLGEGDQVLGRAAAFTNVGSAGTVAGFAALIRQWRVFDGFLPVRCSAH